MMKSSEAPPTSRSFGQSSTGDDVVRGIDLSAKVAIVTGANTGIGFETARALASAGARVLLGCRDATKGRNTAERISLRHPSARVTPFELDLASLSSIRAAVERLGEPTVDLVVCNAGVYHQKYEETADGFEATVGVCHFGHFLLVRLLLDRLRSKKGRVVMVSSESHRHPRTLAFDRFPMTRERYKPMIAYGQAKLCNVLFANELDRRYRGDGLVANSLHPGTLMKTDIGRDSLGARILLTLAQPFSKSLAQGAATSVFCATAPELEGVGGRYYINCAERRMSEEAQNAGVASKLWALSEERVGT
jgi:WW domain-containing oxidoreductase